MMSSEIVVGVALFLCSGGRGGAKAGGTGPIFAGREGRAGISIMSGLMDSLLVGGTGAVTTSLSSSSMTTKFL